MTIRIILRLYNQQRLLDVIQAADGNCPWGKKTDSVTWTAALRCDIHFATFKVQLSCLLRAHFEETLHIKTKKKTQLSVTLQRALIRLWCPWQHCSQKLTLGDLARGCKQRGNRLLSAHCFGLQWLSGCTSEVDDKQCRAECRAFKVSESGRRKTDKRSRSWRGGGGK